MKLACYRHNAAQRLDVYTGDGLIEIAGGLAETYPSIRAVIEKSGFAEIESWAAPQGSSNISVAVNAINNRFTFMITSL